MATVIVLLPTSAAAGSKFVCAGAQAVGAAVAPVAWVAAGGSVAAGGGASVGVAAGVQAPMAMLATTSTAIKRYSFLFTVSPPKTYVRFDMVRIGVNDGKRNRIVSAPGFHLLSSWF